MVKFLCYKVLKNTTFVAYINATKPDKTSLFCIYRALLLKGNVTIETFLLFEMFRMEYSVFFSTPNVVQQLRTLCVQPLYATVAPFWLHILQRFNLVKSEYLLRHNSRKLKDFTLLYMLTNANFFPKRTR